MNEAEEQHVRTLFELYREHQSLMTVLREGEGRRLKCVLRRDDCHELLD